MQYPAIFMAEKQQFSDKKYSFFFFFRFKHRLWKLIEVVLMKFKEQFSDKIFFFFIFASNIDYGNSLKWF